jgi:hypothetical protein
VVRDRLASLEDLVLALRSAPDQKARSQVKYLLALLLAVGGCKCDVQRCTSKTSCSPPETIAPHPLVDGSWQ